MNSRRSLTWKRCRGSFLEGCSKQVRVGQAPASVIPVAKWNLPIAFLEGEVLPLHLIIKTGPEHFQGQPNFRREYGSDHGWR